MVGESFIGWDIGGAHLKMAEVGPAGEIISASQIATPLWQGLDILKQTMSDARRLICNIPVSHSFTTTAELVDIFPDRRTGLHTLSALISSIFGDEPKQFYAGKSGWITANLTDSYYDQVASANWHATATYLSGIFNQGILIDVGSTTTDIVAFRDGQLLNLGNSDFERLASSELIYTGVVRTPVMAITDNILLGGIRHPVVAENFATMADVYRLTGDLLEKDDMQPTVDGGAKSQISSARRLARMAGTDLDDMSMQYWLEAASFIADRQLYRIRKAFEVVSKRAGINSDIIGVGAGRFLAGKLAIETGINYIDFTDLLQTREEIKPLAARSATAVAVAQLARLST